MLFQSHVVSTLALVVGQLKGSVVMCWSVRCVFFDGILGTRVGGQGREFISPSANEHLHLARLLEMIETARVLTWLSVHFIVRS